MSTVIDERVLSMYFDNKQFEKNVNTSIGSIENLKKSLDMTGASKGLLEVSESAKRVDMRGLGDSVDTVKTKFSALQVMGVTALANITNSAVNAGKRMIAALTIDPIKTGLQEYELKMNSVQTIMASTGENIDVVNKYLNELNEYSDKTIYSFSDMTSNIGKFTNAGVKLEDAVAAIKGISNEAALSGANANEASRAMYNFSQALSAGYVKLIDWKSIENANMATKGFKEELIKAAVEAGTLTETADGMYKTLKGNTLNATKNFNETLQDQWMTSEVLINTLKDYADGTTEIGSKAEEAATKVKTFTQLMDTLKEAAQSGWAQTWEIVVGDLEEAKNLWTQASDVFGKIIGDSAKARNELFTRTFKNNGLSDFLGAETIAGSIDAKGFENILKGMASKTGDTFSKMIEEEGSFEKALQKGLRTNVISITDMSSAFDKLMTQQLKAKGYSDEMIKSLKIQNGGFLVGSKTVSDYAKSIAKLSGRELLFNTDETIGKLGLIPNILKAIGSVLTPIKEAFTETFGIESNQLYSFLEWLRDFTSKLILTEKQSENLKTTFKGLFAIVELVGIIFKTIATAILNLFGDNISSVNDGILGITASIGELLIKFRDWVTGSSAISDTCSGIAKAMQKLIDVAKKVIFFIGSVFTADGFLKFLESLKKFWDKVVNIFTKIKTFLGGVIAEVKAYLSEFFEGFNWEHAVGIGAGGGIMAIAGGVIALITNIVNLIKSFKNNNIITTLKKAFIDVIGSVGDAFEAFRKKVNFMIIRTIANAILKLAVALLLIAIIPKDKIVSTLAAITTLFGELMLSLAIFNKLQKDGGLQNYKSIKALNKMAGALLILSLSLFVLSKLSFTEIGQGLAAMSGMLLIMFGLMKLLSTFDGRKRKKVLENAKTMTKVSLSLIPMVAALAAVAGIMKLLSTMSWDQIWMSLTAMGIALGGLLVALTAMSLIGKIKVNSKMIGQTIVIVAALAALAGIMKIFASIDSESVKTSMISMGSALGGLLVALTALSLIGKIKVNNKMIGQTVTLVGALAVMSVLMKFLSTMEWDEIWRSLTAMGSALGGLIAALTLLSLVSKIGLSGSAIGHLFAITGIIMTLSVLMKFIATMSWDDIWRSLTAMGSALGGLVAVLALVSLISKIAKPKNIIASSAALVILASALLILAPALAILGGMSMDSIARSIAAIAATLLVIGVAALILKSAVPTILALAAALMAMGTAFMLVGAGTIMIVAGLSALFSALVAGGAALVSVLGLLVAEIAALIPFICKMLAKGIVEFSRVIVEGAPVLAQAAIALILALNAAIVASIPAIVAGILEIVLRVLDHLVIYLPQIVGKIVELLVVLIGEISKYVPVIIESLVGLLMSVFEGLAGAMNQIDPAVLMDGLKSLGIIAALLTALGVIGLLVPAAMAGVLALGLFILELTGVLAAFGALARIDGLQDIIADGGKLLLGVGTAIGQFIGGVAGGLMEGIGSQLPVFGADLSAFMINLQPFLDGIKSLDASMLDNASILVGLILAITAANVVDSLLSFLSFGTNSMAAFGADLALFGVGIAAFSAAVSGINTKAVTAAANAGKTLAEMAQMIPRDNGLFQLFAGNKDLEKFGENLPVFGKGIKAFSTSVNGINCKAVVAAANAGKTLAEMAKLIPNEGGLIALFAGENRMDNFANQLPAFGDGIAYFATAVADMELSNVKKGADAGKMLAEMAEKIPNNGGLVALFSGDNPMDVFGNNLVDFGEGVKAFDKVAAEISLENIAKGVKAAGQLSVMAEKLPRDGGVIDLFIGGNDMDTFGIKLVSFASSLKNFATELADADIAGASSKVTVFTDTLKNFANTGITAFVTQFAIGKTLTVAAVKGMLNAAVDAASEASNGFITVGVTAMMNLIMAILICSPTICSAFETVITSAADGIKSKDMYQKFYDAGAYYTKGFANGIKNTAFFAAQTAYAMAEAVKLAVKQALRINSPSKDGEELGGFFGEGFVNAIDSYTDKAFTASSDMAGSAKSGLSNAISKISSALENDVDTQPTIRPVLDLSNIEAGAGLINGMFGMTPSLGVMAKVGSINAAMNSKNQNGGYTDILSAINDLKDTISDTSGDTYNINGVTYDNGSEIQSAVETLVRYAKIERRR